MLKNVALLTTLTPSEENKRIEEEVCALGYNFKLVNLEPFSFKIENNKLQVTQLENLDSGIVIVRGIFNAIKSILAVVGDMRKIGVRVFDDKLLSHPYSIDKVTDLVKLSLAGIPTPDTYYSRSFDEYSALAAGAGYPLVIKSARSGRGAGVFKVDSQFELTDLVDRLKSEEKDAKGYLIQKFVPYAYDLRILIIGTQLFAMRRIPGEGEFRANFSLGGKVEPFDLDEAGKKMALDALNAIDMSVGGVDMLITEDNKRYILEVNHTAGFVGMEEATGENIAKIYVEHAISNAQ